MGCAVQLLDVPFCRRHGALGPLMLDRIRALFSADPSVPSDDAAAHHLAAAVLLVEVAKADHALDQIELQRLSAMLQRHWSLSDQDLTDLVAAAQNASDAHVSLHEHIELINRHFSVEQKFELVCSLWQVAIADDSIHHHEELLVRRIADLLYVPHRDFIRAKHLAIEGRRGI